MMNNKQQLELAIEIAMKVHKGQPSIDGYPYAIHPLTLMMQCLPDLEMAAMAVLHDVIEDGGFTATDLLINGISQRVVDVVVKLTRKPGQSYGDYIKCMFDDVDAVLIKLDDIEQNMDEDRIINEADKDPDRMKKYEKARDQLNAALLKLPRRFIRR